MPENNDLGESLGAVPHEEGTTFTVFADRASTVAVRLLGPQGEERNRFPLQHRLDGIYAVTLPGVGPGSLYDFVVDERILPDPYARSLPRGVHGPAAVTARSFPWEHGDGVAVPLDQQIIYELHVGTFTPEGTYAGALSRLPFLKDLGITTIELMPVASFAGRWGWGYDGVALFAPHAPYGTPDDLRRFVDAAHGLGISVLLDVVYNHFGPAGNYLSAYSGSYFHEARNSPWGQEPDFMRPAMRRLVLANVRYWLEEMRFDGLRLDATHAINDESSPHILAEIAALAHGLSPRKLVIAEDDRNEVALIRRHGLDAIWADDFHHVVHVTATGERDGYYANYQAGGPALAAAVTGGWTYQGETYPATGAPRGTSTADLAASCFVYALQNHDQIGNRPFGERLNQLVEPERLAGLTALLFFLPMTPLLFMGQEWAASSPFLYFTDHDPELGRLVSEGRRKEFRHFRSFGGEGATAQIPDPQAEETFLRSKLRWEERERPPHARVLTLFRKLIALRSADRVLRDSPRAALEIRGADDVLVCRRRLGDERRTFVLNLGSRELDTQRLEGVLGRAEVLVRTDREGAEPAERPSPLAPFAALIAND